MRIIQVTDYGSPFPGSFAPMLAAALGEAVSRGWRPQLVLPARAGEREWLSILAEHQERIVFAPVGTRRARRRWLAGLAAAEPGPTILHSHFSVFDYAVAAIARRRRDVRAFWHLHTVLSDSLSIRLANRFKLGVASRPVERLLCVAPHLAEEVVRRGAPPDKV